jgi:hypothetical protein
MVQTNRALLFSRGIPLSSVSSFWMFFRGGMKARTALQRVRLQAGVVGQRPAAAVIGSGPGLQQGIVGKSTAGFLRLRAAGKIIQAQKLHPVHIQDLGDFLQLVGVPGGNDYLHNGWR